MAIRIRRGTNADRITVVLESGEVAYTTDTKMFYIGDGTTLGGTLIGPGAAGAVAWGAITGTLASQTDLNTALGTKVTGNTAITGATKTKITYDSKGLVTVGADATTADISASTNKNYVTDAQQTVITNTSGTNTGNQTLANTSDSSSHTATLSATGGSIKLVEGSNITLTTTGTTADGIITIDSSVTAAALTKVDDTNVTLTLGGTPTTALLQSTSLTLGWTGTLADSRITSASTWNAKADYAPRVQSVTSSATVTPTSTNDLVKITAQATGLTIANPTGTMSEGQAMIIRIKDNGTAQTIAFGTNYRAIGVTLPTTTTISKTIYIGLVWNDTDTKFDVLGINTQA